MLAATLTELPVRLVSRNRPRESVRIVFDVPGTEMITPCKGFRRESVTVPATAPCACAWATDQVSTVNTRARAKRFRTDDIMAGPPFATGERDAETAHATRVSKGTIPDSDRSRWEAGTGWEVEPIAFQIVYSP